MFGQRESVGLLLLLIAISSKRRGAKSKPERPDYNMSPEDQAERLPISTGEGDWVTLERGRTYRISGDLESAAPIDIRFVRGALEAIGARNVQIGERPPHRVQATMTAPITHRMQLGKPVPVISSVLGGVTFRVRSVRALTDTIVTGGARRRRAPASRARAAR